MVGRDAGGNVGAEVLAAETGGMPVNHLPAGKLELIQQCRVATNHPGEVHHLAQPDAVLPFHNLA
ncbi:MAG: hypothetical protein A2Z28_04990 [Chloroflexi bacterium RBG_16_51_9]|nr:MAG: hypothetical protein A2Z28_04990 [Chloroflexi bacterium RBG_16_51_9]